MNLVKDVSQSNSHLTKNNTLIIGYKNHALRVIKIILKKNYFKKVFIFHPELSKLKNIKIKNKAIHLTNDFNVINECICMFICSPSSTHINYVQQAYEIQKKNLIKIYCEKPIAVNSKEIIWLKKNKSFLYKKIYVGFNLIHSDFFKSLKKIKSSFNLGKLIFATFHVSYGISFNKNMKKNWRFNDNNSFSNIYGNLGIHYIHLCILFFGKINKISIEPTYFNKHKNFDNVVINITHESNIKIKIILSYSMIALTKYELFFCNGMLIKENNKIYVRYPRATFDKNGSYKTPPKTHLTSENELNSLEKSIGHFLDSTLKNKNFKEQEYNSAVQASQIVLNSPLN